MSESLEALKRLRQETAPATYMPDFDKKECCDVIERDLKVLEILKKMPFKVLVYKDMIYGVHVDCKYLTTEESEKIKEWLNDK